MQPKANKPIITPKEARKLLGNAGKYLTNSELLDLTHDTEIVLRLLIKQYLRSNNGKIEKQ